ncbi:MAG: GNAT family N-acetyltransferase [Chamaesiphon sp. CSU_1_12]|nr:GNAT family N-acetyltransferase [Chamaesiphon sp. CSU_1_12]
MPLIRVRDASSIVGSLVTLTTKHLNDFSAVWREQLKTSADEDQYWDWEQKQRIYLAGGAGIYEGYAIECERLTQGMMILQVKGYRSQIDANRRLVYVHSLATAPWNRISNPDPNGFRAVGSALLRFARFRSEELDYGGLVGLHSLPTAEIFYRKMGMIDGGSDAAKENLTYFEWYRRDSASIEESRIDEGIESADRIDK